MLKDLASGTVIERELAPRDEMKELLEKSNIEYVSFEDWQIIDETEVVQGKSRGAPREKFTGVAEILAMLEERKSLKN